MSKGAARLADICDGHRRISPRANDQGSPDVFINGRPAHRQSDSWPVHRRPRIHKSFLASGSPTVYTNNLQQGRIGDPVACGSKVATGSTDVFIGDTTGQGGGVGTGGGQFGGGSLSAGAAASASGAAPRIAGPEYEPQENEDSPPEAPADEQPVEELDSECNIPVTVKYVSNFANSIRNQPIVDSLYSILQQGARAACVDVVIYSGGQDPPGPKARRRGRTRRHDNGYGADVWIYYEGRRLSSVRQADLPRIIKFIQTVKSAGATGIGMGNGYMDNVGIHVDNAWASGVRVVPAGFTYWGGKQESWRTAPAWLRDTVA